VTRRPALKHLGRAARWTGYALLVLLALVGFLFVMRGTAVRHVRGVGADGDAVAPAEPQFPASVTLLTGAVLTGGNRVELALNGNGTFRRLWDDLRAARQSIIIQNYYGKPGQVADTLSSILLERAAAGIRVFVLYDAFGTPSLPRERLTSFRAAGIEAVPFRPLRLSTLWRVQNRSHVRAFVIDGRVGWTGGFGIDDKWLFALHHQRVLRAGRPFRRPARAGSPSGPLPR